jgi:hypothetical protein
MVSAVGVISATNLECLFAGGYRENPIPIGAKATGGIMPGQHDDSSAAPFLQA